MKNIPVLHFHCYYFHQPPESRVTLHNGSKLDNNNNKIQQKYFATNNPKWINNKRGS